MKERSIRKVKNPLVAGSISFEMKKPSSLLYKVSERFTQEKWSGMLKDLQREHYGAALYMLHVQLLTEI